jgi:hypothetical protein
MRAADAAEAAAGEGFMKRFMVLVGLLLAFECGLHAQAAGAAAGPVDVNVCDVVKNPASFDGKMVRIKGTVVAGFDEFVIKDASDPNCGFEVNAIWVAYPTGTKGKAGPAAMLTIQPAHNFAGAWKAPMRTPVTLDKSKDFKQFDSLLAQTHNKGGMCLGCARYEVTATLVGRLDTVADATLKRDASGKIVGFGGFGNMNAYPARLVLASVSDVSPKEEDYSKADAVAKNDMMQQGGGDLQAALGTAQKAYGNPGSSPAAEEAQKAVLAFGKPGEHNGVMIGFGPGNELNPKYEDLGTADSPDGVLFNVTFYGDHLQGPSLERALEHMGDHIATLREVSADAGELQPYIVEYNAWVITVVSAAMAGQKTLTLPGGYLEWDSSLPADQRNDRMESVLKDFLSNEAMLSR